MATVQWRGHSSVAWPQFSGVATVQWHGHSSVAWPQLTELEIDGCNSLKATLPSLQSTKVPRELILITQNEGERIFFSALRAE